jgi:hypothetical protein
MIGGNVPHKRALAGRGSSPRRELARPHSEKLKPFTGMHSLASPRIVASRFVQFQTATSSERRVAFQKLIESGTV